MEIKATTLKFIADLIQAEFIGDPSHAITGFNEIHRVKKGDVVFVDHPKYYDKSLQSLASTIIINKKVDCPDGKAIIIHPEPFTAFNLLTKYFKPAFYSDKNISPTAKIGKHSIIMPGCFIGNDVIIGEHCILHPNVVVYDGCVIGNHVQIHANTTIGGNAFYFKKRESNFEALNSCGSVIIEDHVRIGSNCSIDRGVTAITKIGKGSILDNQIQIGHDVEIGELCLFAAQVGIAGAVTIGNNVTLWGQVGIASGLTIEDGVTVLAQSGVGENIKKNETYFGSPAGPAKEKMKQLFAAKQLPDLIHKLYNPENK
ncbi:MAG: UDP-3-O-(3-hydroxymyristoyl)glucosamine N-acyltransferase [Sphingobacteriaceae bacterium]|nr:UDP-3-O-(3-hydroxymyristoyl)glucosamine N-acyltransferase [Sphingobacteriaceae bacterium]